MYISNDNYTAHMHEHHETNNEYNYHHNILEVYNFSYESYPILTYLSNITWHNNKEQCSHCHGYTSQDTIRRSRVYRLYMTWMAIYDAYFGLVDTPIYTIEHGGEIYAQIIIQYFMAICVVFNIC